MLVLGLVTLQPIFPTIFLESYRSEIVEHPYYNVSGLRLEEKIHFTDSRGLFKTRNHFSVLKNNWPN